MKRELEIKKILPTYTAPQEIINSIQLEENNEVVDDLNKKISDIIPNKKINSKYKRDISPERVDPLQNLSKQNNTQNLKQRSYKEIMLEQKKREEREKNLMNRMNSNEKSKQYNNINYYSRTFNLSQNSKLGKEITENNSIFTKETKWKTEINKYEKSEKSELLSRKRKNDDVEFEIPSNKAFEEDKSIIHNKIKEVNENNSQSSGIIEEKEELEKKGIDELSNLSENYDIPTPKNESELSSDSEATLINEKNLENNEEDNDDNESKMKLEKSINDSGNKSKQGEDIKNKENEEIIPKIKEDLKYNLDFIERNRPLTDEEINLILPGEKDGYQIVPPPIEYQQKINNYLNQKIQKYSSDPLLNTQLYDIPEEKDIDPDNKIESEIYNGLKPEDRQFFQVLLQKDVDETKLSKEEIKKRKVFFLLI